MARLNAREIFNERRRRATDLRALGETLLNGLVCDDVGPLESAAHQCASTTPATGDWTYDVSMLRFQLPQLAGGRPSGMVAAVATLSVSLCGHLAAEVEHGDPLARSTINLVLTGSPAYGSETGIATAAWHFDRHTGEEDEVSNEIHPLYHVQYGGRRMQAVDLGQTLLCDAPRLIHPPMDAVLAVDLVVSNFMYGAWTKLRQDPTYMRLVAASFRQFWHPWFSYMASFWDRGEHLRWRKHNRLYPGLPDEPLIPAFAQAQPAIRSRAGKSRKKH